METTVKPQTQIKEQDITIKKETVVVNNKKEDDDEEYDSAEYTDATDSQEDNDGFDDDEFNDDDAFGDNHDDDADGGWDDDVEEVQYVPITPTKSTPNVLSSKDNDDSKEQNDSDNDSEYEIDEISGLVRQKSEEIPENKCWTCSNCKSVNNLMLTMNKYWMKCCICEKDTYSPNIKLFFSDKWAEPKENEHYWVCKVCTLQNKLTDKFCSACSNGKNSKAQVQTSPPNPSSHTNNTTTHMHHMRHDDEFDDDDDENHHNHMNNNHESTFGRRVRPNPDPYSQHQVHPNHRANANNHANGHANANAKAEKQNNGKLQPLIRVLNVVNVDGELSTLSRDKFKSFREKSQIKNDEYCVSDCDAELLVLIEFSNVMNLRNIVFFAKPLTSINTNKLKFNRVSQPKRIEIFKLNSLNADFDDINKMKPDAYIECSPQRLGDGDMLQLYDKIQFKQSKFLAVCVRGNQRGTDKTYIHGIIFETFEK